MPSLYEILKTATTALKKVAVSSPDLDARLLLEDVLQKDKSFDKKDKLNDKYPESN